MADKHIIDGIEYETEPSYMDSKTGKPVFYAKDIPVQIRRAGELTADDIQRAEALDTLSHLERLQRGADDWNHWVKVYTNRWLDISSQNNGEGKYLFISGRKQAHFEVSSDREKLLDFSLAEGLVIPANIYFRECRFATLVRWDNANFMGVAQFTDCTFDEDIRFYRTYFQGRLYFSNVLFGSYFSLVEADIQASVVFSECSFQRNLEIDRTECRSDCKIHGCVIEESALFFDTTIRKNLWLEMPALKDLGCDKLRVLGSATLIFDQISGSSSFHHAWFARLWFGGQTKFIGEFAAPEAVFIEHVDFGKCEFRQVVDLGGAQFLGSSNFSSCKFTKRSYFEHVWFGKNNDTPVPETYKEWDRGARKKYDEVRLNHMSATVPDLRGATFETPPDLGYTNVPDIPAPKWVWSWVKAKLFKRLLSRFWQQGVPVEGERPLYAIADSDAAAKLRVLGELAARGHHHLAEKRFFRAELLARRGWETKTGYEVAMINAFELFSKCGLSFWRPVGWLFVTMVLCGLFYLTQIDWPVRDMTGEAVFELFSYSFANSLPLLGYISDSYGVSVDLLFGGLKKVPGWVRFVAFLQNAISAILIFFGLLAIRNYFKLG